MGDDAGQSERLYSFGPFTFYLSRRLLLDGDQPVRLGSRALDTLIVLLDKAGAVVGKDELIAKVWPDTFVEDNNIKVHISSLRRVLGDGRDGRRYIVTIAGRGYSFVEPVIASSARQATAPVPDMEGNLPYGVARLVGRQAVVAHISNLVREKRISTIVGPGGIGKTSVAIAAVERAARDLGAIAFLLDLSPVQDGNLVPNLLATALGMQLPGADPYRAFSARIGNRPALVILDNCEHLIDAAAAFALALTRAAPTVHVMATSREPLRIEGEHLYRLAPLTFPAEGVAIGPDDATSYSAVQLFIERAIAAFPDLRFSAHDFECIGKICRQIDGIPLAIEFASAYAGTLGLQGLGARLADHVDAMPGRRRGALDRHETMRATLDWSFGLLLEAEQTLLVRLAIFSGGFTFAAVNDVVGDGDGSTFDDLLLSLIDKSLVSTTATPSGPRLKLLETTRAYARDLLGQRPEVERIARAHAKYYATLLSKVWPVEGAPTLALSPADLKLDVDNVRAALDWALSERGDVELAAQLSASSGPLWLGLSLLAEGRDWMARAAALLGPAKIGSREEMVIQSYLASAESFTSGFTPAAVTLWGRTRQLAETHGDDGYLRSSLLPLWLYHLRIPDYAAAMSDATAHQDASEFSKNDDDRVTSWWMIGTTAHHLGDLALAKHAFQRFLELETPKGRKSFVLKIGFDRRAAVLGILGLTLAMEGDRDSAVARAREGCAGAKELGYALAIAESLKWACVTQYVIGDDLETFERMVAQLTEIANGHALGRHQGFAKSLQGMCRVRRGDFDAGIAGLHAGLSEFERDQSSPMRVFYATALADALCMANRIEEGLDVVRHQEEIEGERGSWGTGELFRAKGSLLMAGGHPAAAATAFHRAEDIATRQGAKFWLAKARAAAAALADDVEPTARA